MTIKNAGVRRGVTASIGRKDPWLWMERGICSKAGIDLTYLDDFKGRSKKRDELVEEHKKELCFPCPVRVSCLAYILRHENLDKMPSSGLWGGTYGAERTPLRHALKYGKGTPEELAERWINRKALWDSEYIVIVRDANGELIRELNANSPTGAKIVIGKAKKTYGKDIQTEIVDSTEGIQLSLDL